MISRWKMKWMRSLNRYLDFWIWWRSTTRRVEEFILDPALVLYEHKYFRTRALIRAIVVGAMNLFFVLFAPHKHLNERFNRNLLRAYNRRRP